jgi:hypothetical protein
MIKSDKDIIMAELMIKTEDNITKFIDILTICQELAGPVGNFYEDINDNAFSFKNFCEFIKNPECNKLYEDISMNGTIISLNIMKSDGSSMEWS